MCVCVCIEGWLPWAVSEMVLIMTRLPDVFPTRLRGESAQDVGSQNSPKIHLPRQIFFLTIGMLVTLAAWATNPVQRKSWLQGAPSLRLSTAACPHFTPDPFLLLRALFKLFRGPQGLLHFEGISCNLAVINGLCWIFLSLSVGGFQGIFLVLI